LLIFIFNIRTENKIFQILSNYLFFINFYKNIDDNNVY